jgi:hypothetical protein
MHLHEPFPLRRYLGLSLLGLGCGFVGAMSGARIASDLTRGQDSISIPEISVAPAIEPIEVATTMSKHTDALPPVTRKPGFVIEVEGSSWFVLDVDPSTIDSHAKSHLEADEYPTTTLAPLHDRDLTKELRAWRGQGVVVDSGCLDVVHDFALVHVLGGDPAYADEDNVATAKWTRRMIDAHGTAYVVAKLEHCTGTYARSELAPWIVAYEDVSEDPTKIDLDVARATDDLMKSDIGEQVKQAFIGQMADEHDTSSAFDKVTEISTKVALDPRTHTKWIAVHAHADFMCGGPQINFWGLYRVEGDHVIVVKQAKLESLAQITSLIDVDGDGIPEILGGGWISPTNAIYDLEENTVVSYDVPFFGCPC